MSDMRNLVDEAFIGGYKLALAHMADLAAHLVGVAPTDMSVAIADLVTDMTAQLEKAAKYQAHQ